MPGSDAKLGDRELLSSPDLLAVRKRDPGRVYRWLHKNETNIERKKLMGYRIEKKDQGAETESQKVNGSTSDNSHQVGDMILGSIPRELYEKRAAARHEEIQERKRYLTERFQHDVERFGRDRTGKQVVVAMDPAEIRREAERTRKE